MEAKDKTGGLEMIIVSTIIHNAFGSINVFSNASTIIAILHFINIDITAGLGLLGGKNVSRIFSFHTLGPLVPATDCRKLPFNWKKTLAELAQGGATN